MGAVDDEPLSWPGDLPARRRHLQVLGLRPLLATGAAVVVLLLSAADARWLLAAPVVVVGVGVALRRLLVPSVRGRDKVHVTVDGTAVGAFVLPRLVVVGAVALVVVRGGAPGRGLLLGALVLLTGCLLLEPSVRVLLQRAVPYALGLPPAFGPVRNWPVLDPSLAVLASLLTLAGTAAVVVGGAGTTGSLVVLLAAGCVAAVLGTVTLDAMRRTGARGRFESRVPELLETVRPRIVVHWEAPVGTGYQLRMWLPHIDRTGVPYVVVLRDDVNVSDVLGATSAPVILRPALEHLDDLDVPPLRLALYVNTSTKNQHLVRYSSMSHVQLNHGDSDKTPSHNPAFRLYDRNLVAGQAAVDRFVQAGVTLAPDFFRIVGRPQVADILPADGPVPAHPTVLYAPTWRGFYEDSDYTSLPHGPEIVRALVDRGARVIFRPHPFTRNDRRLAAAEDEVVALLRADRARRGTRHVTGPDAVDRPIVELFNEADVLVSDVSSVVPDFLFSGKPYALVSTRLAESEFGAEVPLAAGGYVVDGRDPASVRPTLDAALDAVLAGDERAGERERLRTHYLGDLPREGYADRFVEVIHDELRLADERARARAHAWE